MKLKLIVATSVALALSACHTKSSNTQIISYPRYKLYHFDDGRYGYIDNSGIWWYLFITNNASPTSPTTYYTDPINKITMGSTSWASRPAPSAKDLEEAEQLPETEVDELETTDPLNSDPAAGTNDVTTPDASPGDADGGGGADGTGGSGGGGD